MMTENVLVTFDIDQTLLVTVNRAHNDSFSYAVEVMTEGKVKKPICELIDRPLSGNTDYNIATQAIINVTGKEPTPECLQKFESDMVSYFKKHFDGKVQVLPGVPEALEALSKFPNVKLALCTGNFSEIGIMKLQSCDLYKYFEKDKIAGWGYHCDRSKMILEDISKGEKIIGKKFDRVIHVGDTPFDVKAALDANVIPVFVCTNSRKFTSIPTPRFELSNLAEKLDDFLSIVRTGHPLDPSIEKK